MNGLGACEESLGGEARGKSVGQCFCSSEGFIGNKSICDGEEGCSKSGYGVGVNEVSKDSERRWGGDPGIGNWNGGGGIWSLW